MSEVSSQGEKTGGNKEAELKKQMEQAYDTDQL